MSKIPNRGLRVATCSTMDAQLQHQKIPASKTDWCRVKLSFKKIQSLLQKRAWKLMWQCYFNVCTGREEKKTKSILFWQFLFVSLVVLKCFLLVPKPHNACLSEKCAICAAFLMVIYHCLFLALSALRHLQKTSSANVFWSSATFSSVRFNEVSFGRVC